MPRKKFDIATEFNSLAHKSIVVTEMENNKLCEKVKSKDGKEDTYVPVKRFYPQNKRASIGRDDKNKSAIMSLSNNATRLYTIIQYNIPLNYDRITFNIVKLKELLRIKSINTIKKLFIELEEKKIAQAAHYSKDQIVVLVNIGAVFYGANEALHYLVNRTPEDTSKVEYTPSKKRTKKNSFLINEKKQ